RPFTTTVNQELSDVLNSKIRIFSIFPGSVTGIEPNNERISQALNFAVSDSAIDSSEVTFCVDESRLE
ncbi:MAG: alcohol dehydrogenase, partial [Nitrosarchaeum sp.]